MGDRVAVGFFIKLATAWFLCLISCCIGQTASKVRPMRWVAMKPALHYLTEGLTDMATFKREQLNPLLIERISGTPGNQKAREHIVNHMQNLGWTVEEDRFEDDTPFGRKTFVNVIATLNPGRPQRSVVACHYDSKDMKTKEQKTFIGAIDSAVPCAVMLETAKQLHCLLTKARGPPESDATPDLTLQFVFFDGEEAFDHWSNSDSIYGARHLANKWEERHDLSTVREFILLDLIGTADTHFVKLFKSTSTLYDYLVQTEQHLSQEKLLTESYAGPIFKNAYRYGAIEDDHIPFLRKGVDILHLISVPFPSVWHKVEDDGDHLDFDFIDNFSRIFRVFVSGLMHLKPENNRCR